VEGLPLLLLFLVLWLVDRILDAALRPMRAVRSQAEAGERDDVTVEIVQVPAPEEQLIPTMTKQR